MTSIALRRTRAWGAFGAVLAIIAGAGLLASPAFAAGPVYVVNDDVVATTHPLPAGWSTWADGAPGEWDIRDDGLHLGIGGVGGQFAYVFDGHRYSSLEELMNLLEGSGITVTQGNLEWVCLGVELTMPLLPNPSPSPSATPSATPSAPPESGSTVELKLCPDEDAVIGVGTTSLTSLDTWGMCAGDIIYTSDVFDSFDNCASEYTLEQLFGLLTSYSPAVGIHHLLFGTVDDAETVVTQVVLGTDFRFTAAPDPELAATGTAIGAPVIIGGVLLFVGFATIALVALVRPRRE